MYSLIQFDIQDEISSDAISNSHNCHPVFMSCFKVAGLKSLSGCYKVKTPGASKHYEPQ